MFGNTAKIKYLTSERPFTIMLVNDRFLFAQIQKRDIYEKYERKNFGDGA